MAPDWRQRCFEANALVCTTVDAAQAGFSPADSPLKFVSAGKQKGDCLEILYPETLQFTCRLAGAQSFSLGHHLVYIQFNQNILDVISLLH